MKNYQRKLKNKIDAMNIAEIELIIGQLDRCNKDGSSIYIIGNGGSAATAMHMQNDLGSGLKRRGILDLNIMSLCDNLPVLTALSNDIGFENIFLSQLSGKIKKNDLLVAISCSGDSGNIIKAAEYSRNEGAIIVGMTGFNGGRLKEISDINYHVGTECGEYGIVEDMHMILNHMIYTYYIKGDNNER